MGDTSFWYPSCLAHSINTTFSFSSSVVGQPIFFLANLPRNSVCIYIYICTIINGYIFIHIRHYTYLLCTFIYYTCTYIFFSFLVHPNNWTNPNLLHLLWTFATRYRAGKVFPTSPAVKTSGPSIMIPPRFRSRIFSVEPGFRKQWRAPYLGEVGLSWV